MKLFIRLLKSMLAAVIYEIFCVYIKYVITVDETEKGHILNLEIMGFCYVYTLVSLDEMYEGDVDQLIEHCKKKIRRRNR
jgi:hypothetical protein